MTEKDEELEKLIQDNMELRKVGEKIVEISNDERLQGWYDEEEHQRKVRNSLMASAIRKGWNEGKEAGKAEGLKEGKKEGIEEGKKEGIKVGEAKGALSKQKEIARNLLNAGVSTDIIEKATGISRKEFSNEE